MTENEPRSEPTGAAELPDLAEAELLAAATGLGETDAGAVAELARRRAAGVVASDRLTAARRADAALARVSAHQLPAPALPATVAARIDAVVIGALRADADRAPARPARRISLLRLISSTAATALIVASLVLLALPDRLPTRPGSVPPPADPGASDTTGEILRVENTLPPGSFIDRPVDALNLSYTNPMPPPPEDDENASDGDLPE
jgi:hypothetical protein